MNGIAPRNGLVKQRPLGLFIHREEELTVPTIVIDLDETLCTKGPGISYEDAEPIIPVVERLREYKKQGFSVAIHTARNMRTFENSVGKINAVTLPIIVEWLARHNVPYDEIHVGKPWCENGGFYVCDKTVRPDEFVDLSHEEILSLIKEDAPQ